MCILTHTRGVKEKRESDNDAALEINIFRKMKFSNTGNITMCLSFHKRVFILFRNYYTVFRKQITLNCKQKSSSM